MDLTPADLAPIKALYADGHYLRALAAGERFGPLRTWGGPGGRLIAGRLAMQLGAPKLGRRLHAVAVREYPANLEAIYYSARYRLDRFGPYSCWRYIQKNTDWADASPDLRGDWASLTGFVCARLRDFERADKYFAQAESLAARRPWIAVERSSVLELQERHEEALAQARRSLELHPHFRPGVQAVGHILYRTGKIDEAIEFLSMEEQAMESGLIAAQLAAILLESNRPADVGRLLDRYEALTPLMEKDIRQWLLARRADAAYRLNDLPAAVAFARQIDEPFYRQFADRVEAGGIAASAKVSLPLSLPKSTDVPTPDRLIAEYWNYPLPLPSPEATVPGDGLPDAEERKRAVDAGWIAREFTLTAEAAHALIAAGLPFVVTLVEVGVSQSRLCIGSDAVRNSVEMIDPQERKPTEGPLAPLLDRFKASGPRGFVIVPPAKRETLAKLEPFFTDAAVYDALFAVQVALLKRDRKSAGDAAARLSAAHPGHRLTAMAAIALARYDQHPPKLLLAAEAACEAFPDDTTLNLARISALRDMGRTAERQAILKRFAEMPDADPLILQSYAQILLTDHRAADEADRILLQSLRIRPAAAAGYYLLGSHGWERQRFAEAIDLDRFAACLDDREEQFAEAYFRVARALNLANDSIRFFRNRLNRDAVPFVPAAKALFAIHLDRDEADQAEDTVTAAIERAEEAGDAGKTAAGELLLFRAEQRVAFGRTADGLADLERAKPLCIPGDWHRVAAKVHRLVPQYGPAIEHLQAALALDPHWIDGHRTYAALLNETRGRQAARDYLFVECRKHPTFYPLLRLKAEFLTGEPDDSAVAATKELIAICPADAWAWRQLALLDADRGRPADANHAIAKSAAIEPDNPSHFAVAAHVAKRDGRIDDAISLLKDAVRANPDFEPAIAELVNISRGRKEKGQSLKAIAEQLRKRPHAGDGLVAYRDAFLNLAEDDDDHEKLLDRLQKFLDLRPDLWQAWSLVVQQYGIMHRLDESYSTAKETVERFPLAPKVWLDLAEICRVKDLDDERIDALRMAVRAAPGWSPAARELADALKDAGEEDEALALLERTVARNPADPIARGCLAERLWAANRGDEAIDAAEAAVRHEPGFEWAWGAVADWSDRVGQPGRALALAKSLAEERHGDPRIWMKLARFLDVPSGSPQALEALDKAIALDPANIDAHDMRAERLAELGRYDEALAACRPPGLGEEWPMVLQGRAAWVEARRGNFAAAIPPMQKLVSVNSDYVWGWHQLAEWYNETGRSANFLEAAGELVRLRPDQPMPLALRGEAKLQTGDRAAAKDDLREALRLNPRYAPAAALLFDVCLADGEMREARSALAVLQEHLEGPEVAVKQIKYAVKAGDADAAMRSFGEICQSDGETSPAVYHVALGEFREAGWEERAAETMANAVHAGPPFDPFAALFWLDTRPGEAAEPAARLALLDKAIAGYPQFVHGYDRKAVLLAHAGRTDDAVAACHPAVFGHDAPVPLRGRAAWLEAERGNRREAIRQMTAVLRDSPDYFWGWKMLANWHEAGGEGPEFLRAAEQIVRLAPADPVALFTRGNARRAADQLGPAIDDYRRAYEMDSRLEEAGYQLVGAQLAMGDADDAAESLERLERNATGPLVRLRGVQVACARRDLTAARRHLRLLAEDPETPKSVLREAIAAADDAGWRAETTDELDAAARGQNPTPAAVALTVERGLASGSADAGIIEKVRQTNPAAAAEAILALAAGHVQRGQNADAVALVDANAELLRETPTTWAKAGALYTAAGQYDRTIAWMKDWQSQLGLTPWMLLPLLDSYRAAGQDDSFLSLARFGLSAADDGDAGAFFAGWLALDAALAGRRDEAMTLLDTVDPLGKSDSAKLVLTMARVVADVAARGKAAFADAKADLQAALDACTPEERPPGLAPWYRRVVAALGQSGGLAAKLWAGWQKLKPAVR
jgi:tetratricopeptide (TPR) repeat protein